MDMKIVVFWSCAVLVIPFAITGILFGIFKEKATKFVAGFNTLSEEEQLNLLQDLILYLKKNRRYMTRLIFHAISETSVLPGLP